MTTPTEADKKKAKEVWKAAWDEYFDRYNSSGDYDGIIAQALAEAREEGRTEAEKFEITHPINMDWQKYIELDKKAAELVVEVAQLRDEVREWLCVDCRTVYPGPPQNGFFCVICPKCEGNTMPRGMADRMRLRSELAAERAAREQAEKDGEEVYQAMDSATWCLDKKDHSKLIKKNFAVGRMWRKRHPRSESDDPKKEGAGA